MKKNSLLLLFVLITAIVYSQRKEVCASEEIVVESLNEINKCAAETKKKKSLIKGDTEIVARRKMATNRYLIKRKKKVVSKRVSKVKKTRNKQELKATNLDCAGVAKVNPENVSKSISAKDLASYLAEKEYIKFEEVEEIPLFESCNEKDTDKLSCFNTSMANYIADNFEYDEDVVSENEVERVHISFVIGKRGEVTNIKTKGYKQATELHKDLVKLIENLPTFVPAKNKGENVSIKYEFEMNLSL